MDPVAHIFPGRRASAATAAWQDEVTQALQNLTELVVSQARRIEALEREANENGWAHK